jgi:hypothetical protein
MSEFALRKLDRLVLELKLHQRQNETSFRRSATHRGLISFQPNYPANLAEEYSEGLSTLAVCVFGESRNQPVPVYFPEAPEHEANANVNVPLFQQVLRRRSENVKWDDLETKFSNTGAVLKGIDGEHELSMFLSDDRWRKIVSQTQSLLVLAQGNRTIVRLMYKFVVQLGVGCGIRNVRLLPQAMETAIDNNLFLFLRHGLLQRLLWLYGLDVVKFEPRRVMFERLVNYFRTRALFQPQAKEPVQALRLPFEDVSSFPEKSFAAFASLLRGGVGDVESKKQETENENDASFTFLINNEREARQAIMSSPTTLQTRWQLLVEFIALMDFVKQVFVIEYPTSNWLYRINDLLETNPEKFNKLLGDSTYLNNLFDFFLRTKGKIDSPNERVQRAFNAAIARIETLQDQLRDSNPKRVDEQISQARKAQSVYLKQQTTRRELKANRVVEQEAEQQFVDYLLEHGFLLVLERPQFRETLHTAAKCLGLFGSTSTHMGQEVRAKLLSLLTWEYVTLAREARGFPKTEARLERIYEAYIEMFQQA